MNLGPYNEKSSRRKSKNKSEDASNVYHCCQICAKNFKYLKSLKHHVSQTHPDDYPVIFPPKITEKKFACSACSRQYSKLHHMRFHERRDHNINTKKTPLNFECGLCAEKFSSQYQRHSHRRKVHADEIKACMKRYCLLCDTNVPSNEILIHYNTEHDINIETIEIEFASIKEFHDWKEVEEKKTFTSYRKCRGLKSSLNFTKSVFVCHRSGHFKARSTGKRRLKFKGSNKINGYCPAQISLTESKTTKNCFVNFVKTHIGHTHDIDRVRLSESDKQMIASKIASKVPFDRILDEVRDSISTDNFERVHLLTKKDLNNIVQCYKLSSNEVRRQNDAVSFDHRINEMEESQNCVFFFKPNGILSSSHPQLTNEDFVLIIMNNTQQEMLRRFSSDCICIDTIRSTKVCAFQLSALLVVDELGQGFPCAFLISSRMDSDILTLFYSCVKSVSLERLSPRVFMSDLEDFFYDAWVSVVDVPQSRWFCSWHVDRAWRNDLQIIKNGECRVSIYKTLRTLLQEVDEDVFESSLSNAIDTWSLDMEVVDFKVKFRDFYVPKKKLWAYCYRKHSRAYSSMHMEAMHRSLKYIYREDAKQVDKAVHTIMRFVKDKARDRLMMMNEAGRMLKLQDLKKRHLQSDELKTIEVKEVDGKWKISFSSKREVYTIDESTESCSCSIICQLCKTCIHRYSCTCIDSAIKWNMCKHIHYLCQKRLQKQQALSSFVSEFLSDCGKEGRVSPEISTLDINSDVDEENINPKSGNDLLVKGQNVDVVPIKEKLKKEVCDYIDSINTYEELQKLQKMFYSIAPAQSSVLVNIETSTRKK